MLNGEASLPAGLARLLRDPPPAGVWHLPGQLPPAATYRATLLVAGALLAAALAPFGYAGFEVATQDTIDLVALAAGGALVLSALVLYLVGRMARRRARQRVSALLDEGRRFGLWLTDEHLLVVDENGPRAVRRDDITSLRLHRVGRRRRDLLAVELREGRLRFAIDRLEGWAGRAEALHAEVDRRQKAWRASLRGQAANESGATAEDYAANRQFEGFMRWLDRAVSRLQPEAAARAQLLELTARALASWPDETRRAPADWFLADAAAGGHRRFAREQASWLLPLSRAVTFDAASCLPDAASVLDCAVTFRNVPLTVIEIEGSLGDASFEAVLAWAATKPLKTLAVSGATERQRVRLAAVGRPTVTGRAAE